MNRFFAKNSQRFKKINHFSPALSKNSATSFQVKNKFKNPIGHLLML
jgi:hypothetical protein